MPAIESKIAIQLSFKDLCFICMHLVKSIKVTTKENNNAILESRIWILNFSRSVSLGYGPERPRKTSPGRDRMELLTML